MSADYLFGSSQPQTGSLYLFPFCRNYLFKFVKYSLQIFLLYTNTIVMYRNLNKIFLFMRFNRY